MVHFVDNSEVSLTLDKPEISVVAVGDIGVTDDVIHIGDEAMFQAFTSEVRSRGIDHLVGISANPTDSAERYGIGAIERIGFTGSREQMEGRMSAVLRAVEDPEVLDQSDTAHAVIAAIGASNGVAIAGGGNLASNWPLHIFERASLAAIARMFDKPLVISGQTLGPTLSPADRSLVADMLGSAALVGVRESASLALAAELGVTATATVDDASFLVTGPVEPQPYCLVTFSTHLGGIDRSTFIDRAVELIDSVDLEPVFLAHYGSTIEGRILGDSVLHETIRARTGGRVILPTTATAAATLAREASLVITSRYHPAVFAVPAGVPTIGIPVDEYTTVKLTGALANFGQHGILPLEQVMVGTGPAFVNEIWAARERIRADSSAITAANRRESVDWWDAVAAIFGGPAYRSR